MSDTANRSLLTLEDMQQESLRILKLFAAFCDEFGLRYSLAGGTLLGAVRHRGFIPWDDDVDVMLPRPDYEHFRTLSKEMYERTGLILQGYPNVQSKNPSYIALVNPVIKRKSHYFRETYRFGIDVFPVDGLPVDEKEAEKIYKRAKRLRRILQLSFADRSSANSIGRLIVKNAFAFVDSLVSIGRRSEQQLVDLAVRYPYESSSYVGSVAWGLYGTGERMEKEAFENFVPLPFEGHDFNAVGCWDSYLSGIYGNYMQLPPERDRHPHDREVWI